MENTEHWTWRSLRWTRDHAGAFLATFGMIMLLFGISGLLAYAFFQLDYHFSRPLAGDVIPPNVTQSVAWGIRLFTLVAGSMAIYFHTNNMPRWRRGSVWLGGIGAVLLMLHAYGIAAKIMEGQYVRAAAIEVSADAELQTVVDQIADIDAAIIRAGNDRDVALEVAQDTIEGVKDPVAGLSAADNQTIREANADKAVALAAYSARVAELEADKKLLRESEGEETGDSAQSKTLADTFNPLFVFLARISNGFNFDPAMQPPDGHKYLWGAAFFTFFFGFGEVALIFCLTGAFAALVVVSARKKRSASAKKGHNTRAENDDQFSREQRRKLKVQNNLSSYIPAFKRAKSNKVKRPKYVPEATADYYFSCSVERLDDILNQMVKADLISSSDADLLMDRHLPATINPNAVDDVYQPPKNLNGKDNDDVSSDDQRDTA